MIAVEGTHASGKTTLTHALAAHYREQGIHVATVEEPARHSPFVEEIVVHGKGCFDLETEVDLFAAQLSAQLRAARQHTDDHLRQDHRQRPGLRLDGAGNPAAQPCRHHAGCHGHVLPRLGRHLRCRVLLLRPVQPAPAGRSLPRQGPGPAISRRPGRPLHLRQHRPERHRHPARHDHRRTRPLDRRPARQAQHRHERRTAS